VDLVSGELGFGKGAGQQNRSAVGIDFHGMLVRLVQGEYE
jgi:hypothetical protein